VPAFHVRDRGDSGEFMATKDMGEFLSALDCFPRAMVFPSATV
jgi:hypothetical protein